RPQQEAEDTGDATPLSGLVDTDAGQPYLAKSAPPIVPVRVFLGTTPPPTPAGPPLVIAGDKPRPKPAAHHKAKHHHASAKAGSKAKSARAQPKTRKPAPKKAEAAKH
ncbi:MAG TPA: hypothetical protein VHD15_06480, partial [Hyphomicrobiales bacterium]|nr:hypothetical protein [Hyphomicrobiales bacterium]